MHLSQLQLFYKQFPIANINLFGLAILGLAVVLITLGWLLVHQLYPFLAQNAPIPNPDAVVVEAWLPYYDLQIIKQDLQANPNTQVIVVGGKFEHEFFTMGHQSDPSLIFHLDPNNPADLIDTLSILASGAYAKGEWGNMEVWIDGVYVGSYPMQDSPVYYHFATPDKYEFPRVVKLVMTNTYLKEAGPKREVRIHHLKIGSKIFNPFSSAVIYGFTNLGGTYTENTLHAEISGFTTCMLQEMGIAPSRLKSITRSTSSGSRTWGNARCVAEWLNESPDTIKSLNVYSQAAHSRRSFEMYRKAIGNQTELGVIALPNKHYGSRWWKTSKGRKLMIEQIIKYLASKLV